MLTEVFGGRCPYCHHDKMYLRFSSFGGSSHAYQLDACPKCGFAQASNGKGYKDFGPSVWRRFFQGQKNQTRREVYEFSKSMPHVKDNTVFNYNLYDVDKHRLFGMQIYE